MAEEEGVDVSDEERSRGGRERRVRPSRPVRPGRPAPDLAVGAVAVAPPLLARASRDSPACGSRSSGRTRRQEDLKQLRATAKPSDAELWDVKILDLSNLGEPPAADEPNIEVHFEILSTANGELYLHRWKMVGVGPSSTTQTPTPLQTLARAAVFAVEDALVVRDAHDRDGPFEYEVLPPGYAFVTDGKLHWFNADYLLVDGQV